MDEEEEANREEGKRRGAAARSREVGISQHGKRGG
jgi:hypothetical protein